MPSKRRPRKGSLQIWPRKRAKKFLPSVNWNSIVSDKSKGLKGFIVYKAGMKSALVKDLTPNSMTKDKQITIPVTILECPTIKIFSIRFYKHSIPAKEILSNSLDKELKKIVKIPKNPKMDLDSIKLEEYDDVRILAYTNIKKTNIKKTPDLSEIALTGASVEEKLNWIKEHLNKEISISNIFEKNRIVDFRGLTKGKGFQGAVKRFGIELKAHKTEKGVRRPGSLGPWHPARVTFRVPMAGQLGMFTRVVYNNPILGIEKSSDKPLKNIKNYGDIKNEYLVVSGSVQGPAKRQLIVTAPLRETKKQAKRKYELIKIM